MAERICKKCNTIHQITQHHVFPSRWFKHLRNHDERKIALCKKCHLQIEKAINNAEGFWIKKGGKKIKKKFKTLEPYRYILILNNFNISYGCLGLIYPDLLKNNF